MAFSITDLFGGKIIENVTDIIKDFIPDPQKKAEAALAIQKEMNSFQLSEDQLAVQLSQGQIDINKIEAGNSSSFVSGWRPACGWSCVIGLIYTFLLQPFLSWGSSIFHYPSPPPIDFHLLMELLLGMLGLGGLRTYEKVKKVARK